MNVPLHRDEEVVERIRTMFNARGREMPDSNLRQADVPEGATIIPQTKGTAPGLICPVGPQGGLRRPRRALRDGRHVRAGHRPRPRGADGRAGRDHRRHRQPGHPDLGYERVGTGRDPGRAHRPASTARRPTAAGRRRRGPSARPPSPSWPAGSRGSRCGSRCGPTTTPPPRPGSTPRRRRSGGSWPAAAGDVVFGIDDEAIEDAVARALATDGLTLGLAESLTGGLAASRLVNVPGASRWFRGSVVSYASEVKFDVLGVPEGPVVSEAAARAMADGARSVLGADVGPVHDRGGRARPPGRPAARDGVRGPGPSRPRHRGVRLQRARGPGPGPPVRHHRRPRPAARTLLGGLAGRCSRASGERSPGGWPR